VLAARTRLIDATGGWPELVEDLIAAVVRRGRTQAQALDVVFRSCSDPGWASKFLGQAGMRNQLQERVGVWVDYVDPGDPVSPADVAEVLELDLDQATGLLGDLSDLGVLDEGTDGVSLDRVVHRCLATVRRAP
jgi:hypothetical protein